MQTIDSKVKSRVYGYGRGSVFTPNDFLDVGGRDAVDKALSRLAAGGTIRRLARGLYEYPREHPELGTLSPNIQKVAKALPAKIGFVCNQPVLTQQTFWGCQNKFQRRPCS
jgi:hypothetical protein